jgi:hypothetical protein
MSDPPPDRANNREVENEDLKPGRPPRPATEPRGAEGSSDTAKTRTDPASGEQDGAKDVDGDIGPESLRDTPKVG